VPATQHAAIHRLNQSACLFYPGGSLFMLCAAVVAIRNYPYNKFKLNCEPVWLIIFPIVKLRISISAVTWRCTNITAKERNKSGNAIAVLNLYLTAKWIYKVSGAD